jgi:hypothetical protein
VRGKWVRGKKVSEREIKRGEGAVSQYLSERHGTCGMMYFVSHEVLRS